MSFHVGDKVIHWNFGLGEIIQMDEKLISGQPTQCYVVRIRDLTIWVPAGEMDKSSLRLPTPRNKFDMLFGILRSPGQPLSGDRFERKTQLSENMKDGGLEGMCHVVRDLTSLRLKQKLNENDKFMLERAQGFLLTEWMHSLSVPLLQAQSELLQLLSS